MPHPAHGDPRRPDGDLVSGVTPFDARTDAPRGEFGPKVGLGHDAVLRPPVADSEEGAAVEAGSAYSAPDATTPAAFSDNVIVKARADLVSTNLGDEAAILSLPQGVYYGLNAVGARVWDLIQAPQRFGDICEALLAEYDVTPERCREDLQALLQDLEAHNLIETYDSAPA